MSRNGSFGVCSHAKLKLDFVSLILKVGCCNCHLTLQTAFVLFLITALKIEGLQILFTVHCSGGSRIFFANLMTFSMMSL